MYIALAILAFGFIIAIHELGHYLAAKALNVKVNEFAIGMGPKLIKKQGKETLYTLRALPFGGFCALEGQDEESEHPDPRSFLSQKRWRRIVILSAGSAANFITAFIIIFILTAGESDFMGTKLTEVDENMPRIGSVELMPGDRLVAINGERLFYFDDYVLFMRLNAGKQISLTIDRNGERIETVTGADDLNSRSTTILSVHDQFPEEGPSELMPGDRIVAINGEYVYSYDDYRRIVESRDADDEPVVLTLDRNGETVIYQSRPYERDGAEHFRYSFSFRPGIAFETLQPTILEKLNYSIYQTYNFMRLIRISIAMMISGAASVQDIAGPVGIVSAMNTIGQQAPTTLAAIGNIVFFTAFIGVNVAVINMLPIPAMDGGRILFIFITWIIEKLTRKRLDPKYEGYINTGAFILLICLMVVILYNDVMKIIGG